jgi:hypothetical protein
VLTRILVDKQLAQNKSLSNPATPLATSESELEAAFKANLEEIEQQREEARAKMGAELYFLLMEHKRKDQSLVDQHNKCRERLSHLPAVAKARPCKRVPDRETFRRGGFEFHIRPSHIGTPALLGEDAGSGTVATKRLPGTATTTNSEQSTD